MEGLLPLFFALLAGTMLVLALLALWQSLRSAFGAADLSAGGMLAESATVERQTLADEKESLLRNIKDLEFEHEVGKISDADYQRLDASLRARARDVLRLLDEDLGPYRERAEVLIQKHLQKAVGSAPYRAPREPDTKVAERVCAKCGTTNDVDAKFCKECAHRFDADEPEAPTEEPDAKAATEEPETKKDEEASE